MEEHQLTTVEKIKCAEKCNTTFLATGPRHGFWEGLQTLKDGLEISTAGFNQISVDTDANTMIVGGSVRFGQVIDTLDAVQKQISMFFFCHNWEIVR